MSVNLFFKEIHHIPELPDLTGLSFSNIIDLPEFVHVHDFSSENKFQNNHNPYSIGKYNEKRPNMYKANYLR